MPSTKSRDQNRRYRTRTCRARGQQRPVRLMTVLNFCRRLQSATYGPWVPRSEMSLCVPATLGSWQTYCQRCRAATPMRCVPRFSMLLWSPVPMGGWLGQSCSSGMGCQDMVARMQRPAPDLLRQKSNQLLAKAPSGLCGHSCGECWEAPAGMAVWCSFWPSGQRNLHLRPLRQLRPSQASRMPVRRLQPRSRGPQRRFH
mmetsp:Transcript_82013/g.265822  ORF Transcript_82013/g.265822 Transcript_82013/m.265822 type:complete len:200 (+) Transcript_82013:227-826(+)